MKWLFFIPVIFLANIGLSENLPLADKQIDNVKSLPDRGDELKNYIKEGKGIPGGIYRITQPILVELNQKDSVLIQADRKPVTIVMDGAGPAIKIVGCHEGTASPKTFTPSTWNESRPTIRDIEIIGNHPEADGIELVKCVQPIVNGVSVRWCRHGIRLSERNRNVVVSDCQLYENSGIGLFLDDVNLHQINVSNSHISYNRKGGIVVRGGNVRNLHITGCDIEGNMPGDLEPTDTANIFLDVSTSPGDKSRSIAEVAITGCTIQHSANYGSKEGTIAEGGANIRLKGKEIWPIDSVTISGNVISDTTTSVDISHSMDVTITGNTFFAPKPNNLTVSHSKRIVVNGNTFNPRQFERPGTIRFDDSIDCIISNCIMNDFKTTEGALILNRCEGFLINGNILTGCESGIVVNQSNDIDTSGNLFRRFSGEKVRVTK